MKTLKALLREAPATIAANLGKVLFGATVLGIIGWLGGIFHVYQTIWIFGKILIQSQTPMWATLSLLVLSNYWLLIVTSRKYQTYSKASHKWGTLISAGGLKWLVSHSSGLIRHIKEIPYCPEHERQLIPKKDILFCPKEKCTFEVAIRDINNAYPSIENEIEKTVREL